MVSKHRHLQIVLLLLGGLVVAARPFAASPNCRETLRVAQSSCNPDVDADLVVDVYDLVRVGSKYGLQWTPGVQPQPPEDTNADGLVDIADLVCVSANLGPVFGPVPTVGPAVVATATATPTPTATATVPAPAVCQWASVERVTDGDTVRVRLYGKVEAVRYINVDAPERNEPYGYEATMMNIALLADKEVCLERDPAESRDRDRYDRLLRYVWVDGLLVEAELVEAGLAEVVSYRSGYQYEAWLLALQADAQLQGRGMWE